VYSNRIWAGRPRGWGSSPSRDKNFLFSTASRPLVGPPLLLPNGYQGVFPSWGEGVNLLGREADHSPQTSTDVKNLDIHPSPPIHLHGIGLN
jgi:hypothetical protein